MGTPGRAREADPFGWTDARWTLACSLVHPCGPAPSQEVRASTIHSARLLLLSTTSTATVSVTTVPQRCIVSSRMSALSGG